MNKIIILLCGKKKLLQIKQKQDISRKPRGSTECP